MKTIKQLVLVFVNQVGEKFTLRINDPVEPLDEATVMANMNAIIQSNIFKTSGYDLAIPRSAYVREVVTINYI